MFNYQRRLAGLTLEKALLVGNKVEPSLAFLIDVVTGSLQVVLECHQINPQTFGVDLKHITRDFDPRQVHRLVTSCFPGRL